MYLKTEEIKWKKRLFWKKTELDNVNQKLIRSEKCLESEDPFSIHCNQHKTLLQTQKMFDSTGVHK